MRVKAPTADIQLAKITILNSLFSFYFLKKDLERPKPAWKSKFKDFLVYLLLKFEAIIDSCSKQRHLVELMTINKICNIYKGILHKALG
jgi:hypothetical protein